jgi:hypothetical protein
LYMQTQSVSSDPVVVVELVGTVAGKPVHASGRFRIYDKLFADLDTSSDQARILSARKAFADGNPTSDVLDAYDRITAAVQSISFAHR